MARTNLLAVLVLGSLVGCSQPTPSTPRPPTVISVVDGDTIVVGFAGHRESVRLLGIDTPEIAHGGTPADCFGSDAAARTASLLPPGTVVELLLDHEARDIYGRLLAYVVANGSLVNRQLLAEGYARTLSIAPNRGLAGLLADAEREARRDARGLWGACGVTGP